LGIQPFGAQMPLIGTPLDSATQAMFMAWINPGALNE
jgi:hypothetical protein